MKIYSHLSAGKLHPVNGEDYLYHTFLNDHLLVAAVRGDVNDCRRVNSSPKTPKPQNPKTPFSVFNKIIMNFMNYMNNK